MRRKDSRFDHFAIERVAGCGEMGLLYRARNAETGEVVALKILRPHWAGNEKVEELFLRGAVIAAQIRHPNVVSVRELGWSEGKLYYAMEFVEGEPLHQALARNTLSTDARLRILARVARAAEHLHHRGVLHNDLKPSNIILTLDGEPKITDFDSAVLRVTNGQPAATAVPSPDLVCGTPPYMPPEAFGDGRGGAFDPRRDVYALGVVAYRMVAGVLPYAAPDLVRLMRLKDMEPPDMDLWDVKAAPRLEATIRRALMPDPADRWGSAEDFARAVEGYLKGRESPAKPAAPPAAASAAPAAQPKPIPLRLRKPIEKAACL